MRRRVFHTAIAALKKDDPRREALRTQYREDRQKLRRERDGTVELVLHEALAAFEDKLDKGKFTFALKPGPVVGNKQTYQIGTELSTSFPAKQAAGAIREATATEPPNRNSIVRALKESLDKSYTHAIYKTDIESFFESIPHNRLLQKAVQLPALDGVSIHLISTLLSEFAALTGTNVGLPRGVGLSSQLAELFMADFDLTAKAQPGVLFYARYVDDIVVVIDSHKSLDTIRQSLVNHLESSGLRVKDDKTSEIMVDGQGQYPEFIAVEYLGYRFTKGTAGLTTGLTAARSRRRKRRLHLTFDHWLSTDPDPAAPNHGHDGMLVDRIRYLGSNTRLQNSKSSVTIGLYHSNSSLDENAVELVEMDRILEKFLLDHGYKMSSQARARIEEVSFVTMFSSKPFLRLPQKRIEKIVSIWKAVGA